jgi:ubiquinol-cytochrome c reductase cytochrome c1 subunit
MIAHLKPYFMCMLILLGVQQDAQALLSSINVGDKPSLQRGAKFYINYCSGCHSLNYMHYHRMAEGLGLMRDGQVDVNLLKDNLIFTQASIDDPIRAAMLPEDAKQWFGVVPPDLSLISKEKGPQWLYAYLKSFYIDKSRPFGTNNLLKPGVVMPNILEPLRGELVLKKNNKEPYLSLLKEGELTQAQFDGVLQDLVTFLTYVSEPTQTIRHIIGVFVMVFLGIFLIVVIGLKSIYWKNHSMVRRFKDESPPKG